MSEIKLSVVIPTYNRTTLLINLVKNILNVLPNWAELVVIDNASSERNKFLNFYSQEINFNKIKYVQNKFNVCGDENILRCYEHANGEWVWIVGDDDEITNDCFDIILKKIELNKDSNVFFMHFNWELNKTYKNLSKISDLSTLFTSIHSLGDFNFISSNLVKVEKVNDFIYWSHLYQSSATPVASLALMGLNNNIGCVQLFNEKIIINTFFTNAKKSEDFWDVERVLKCLTNLPSFPFSFENKQIIISEINKICTIWISIKASIRQYLKQKNIRDSYQTYKEILKLKYLYGNLLTKIFIEIVGYILFIFIKPVSFIYLFLKNKLN